MKKYLIFILALYACFSFTKCRKITEEEKLPSASTVGANTFGCLVDGKAWTPYSPISSYAIWAACGNHDFSIFARNRRENEGSDIQITVKNLTSIGPYKIYNKLDAGLIYFKENYYEPWDSFGIVNITRYDTTNKIISGTFAFYGKNKQFNKSVNITDGRFDVVYPYKK